MCLWGNGGVCVCLQVEWRGQGGVVAVRLRGARRTAADVAWPDCCRSAAVRLMICCSCCASLPKVPATGSVALHSAAEYSNEWLSESFA